MGAVEHSRKLRVSTPELPSGTVTFLFTDIEGSTRLLHELGDAYADALAEHRRVLRDAFARHDGVEVDTQGDSFFVAFSRASDALAAAREAQAALNGPVWVRMGLHTGEPLVTDEGYVGIDVHRAARIAAAGHGGQVLVSQSTRDLVGADGLRDLGEHRLKDLTAPERIYQLGGDDFPPLASLNRTNLPVATSPLIGRVRELGDLLELIRDGTRLVTITGPGGTGKTRLALQAAAEVVAEFDNGVFWVPLAAIRDDALIPAAITRAAEVQALDDLRNRRVLLLLDNLEHLAGAPDSVAELIRSAPDLRVLATSRSPLRITAEREYPLDPLDEGDAVAFFVDRAAAAGKPVAIDETVAEICRRLDDLPLAIELAAARVRMLDPSALLARLERRLPLLVHGPRDLPERQRTLRSAIEWSYDLLPSAAREMFARLGVFVGTFSLEAAEQVCNATLDDVESLVELSLLKSLTGERFLMLETIREYAVERLGEGDPEELRRRHALYFLSHAEDLGSRLHGTLGDPERVQARLAVDLANIRAAVMWGDANGEHEAVIRALTAMWTYWFLNGPEPEVVRILERPLDIELPTDVQRARLRSLQVLHQVLGDLDRAVEYSHERVELASTTDDEAELGAALNNLGMLEHQRGNLEEAEVTLRKAARLNPAGQAAINLGNVLRDLGRFDDARQSFLEGRSQGIATGEIDDPASVDALLAGIEFAAGNRAETVRLLHSAMPKLLELSWLNPVRACFLLCADIATTSQRYEAAARIIGASQPYGSRGPMTLVPKADAGFVDECRAALGAERFEALANEGRAMSLSEAVDFALASID